MADTTLGIDNIDRTVTPTQDFHERRSVLRTARLPHTTFCVYMCRCRPIYSRDSNTQGCRKSKICNMISHGVCSLKMFWSLLLFSHAVVTGCV